MVETKKAKWYHTVTIKLGLFGGLAGMVFGGGCASQYSSLEAKASSQKIEKIENSNSKRKYLTDKPFKYPAEINEKCTYYWDNGKPIEWIFTGTGFVAASANDVVELPFNAVFGLFKADNIPRYIFDGLPGGRTYNETYGSLFFHSENPGWHPEGILTRTYEVEGDPILGTLKLGLIHGSTAALIVLPLIHHGNGGGAGAIGPGPTPVDPF